MNECMKSGGYRLLPSEPAGLMVWASWTPDIGEGCGLQAGTGLPATTSQTSPAAMTTLASTGCPVTTRVLCGSGSMALGTENILQRVAVQQMGRGQGNQENLRWFLKATARCIFATSRILTCSQKAEATPNNLQIQEGVREGEDKI